MHFDSTTSPMSRRPLFKEGGYDAVHDTSGKESLTPLRVNNSASPTWLSSSNSAKSSKHVTFTDENTEAKGVMDVLFSSAYGNADHLTTHGSASPPPQSVKTSSLSPGSPSRALFSTNSSLLQNTSINSDGGCARCQHLGSLKVSIKNVEQTYLGEIESLKSRAQALTAERDAALSQLERMQRAADDTRQAYLIKDRELQAFRSDALQAEDQLDRLKREYTLVKEVALSERGFFCDSTRFYLVSAEAAERKEIEAADLSERYELQIQLLKLTFSLQWRHEQHQQQQQQQPNSVLRSTFSDVAHSTTEDFGSPSSVASLLDVSPRRQHHHQAPRLNSNRSASTQCQSLIESAPTNRTGTDVVSSARGHGSLSDSVDVKGGLIAELASSKRKLEERMQKAESANDALVSENEHLRRNINEFNSLTDEMQNEIDDLIANETLLREEVQRRTVERDCALEWAAIAEDFALGVRRLGRVRTAYAEPTVQLPPLSLDKGSMEWRKTKMQHSDPFVNILTTTTTTTTSSPPPAPASTTDLETGGMQEWQTVLRDTVEESVAEIAKKLPTSTGELNDKLTAVLLLLQAVHGQTSELARDRSSECTETASASQRHRREKDEEGGREETVDRFFYCEMMRKLDAVLLEVSRVPSAHTSSGSGSGNSAAAVAVAAPLLSSSSDLLAPAGSRGGLSRSRACLAPLALDHNTACADPTAQRARNSGSGVKLLSPLSALKSPSGCSGEVLSPFAAPKQVRFEGFPSFPSDQASPSSPSGNSISGSRFMVPGEEQFHPEQISFSGIDSHEWDLLDSDDESIPPVPESLTRTNKSFDVKTQSLCTQKS